MFELSMIVLDIVLFLSEVVILFLPSDNAVHEVARNKMILELIVIIYIYMCQIKWV